ncbi:MAG: hypothetical protein ACYDEX_09750 [Mobilitalea sp.]
MAEVSTLDFELSKKDIDKANIVMALSLIRKLFEQGKISHRVFLNIKKEYENQK